MRYTRSRCAHDYQLSAGRARVDSRSGRSPTVTGSSRSFAAAKDRHRGGLADSIAAQQRDQRLRLFDGLPVEAPR